MCRCAERNAILLCAVDRRRRVLAEVYFRCRTRFAIRSLWWDGVRVFRRLLRPPSYLYAPNAHGSPPPPTALKWVGCPGRFTWRVDTHLTVVYPPPPSPSVPDLFPRRRHRDPPYQWSDEIALSLYTQRVHPPTYVIDIL